MTTQTNTLELIAPTDPLLNSVAQEVKPDEISSPFVQGVIDRMLELSAGRGHSKHDSRQMVGLAAMQLGVAKRIVTIDLTADGSNKEQTLQVIINPVITRRSTETMPGREGCWSCGNVCGNVERAKEITLTGLDRTGKAITLDLVDFVARIAQHETDHLEGIRFPDRIPVDRPERLHWVEPSEFEEYVHSGHTGKSCARANDGKLLKWACKHRFGHIHEPITTRQSPPNILPYSSFCSLDITVYILRNGYIQQQTPRQIKRSSLRVLLFTPRSGSEPAQQRAEACFKHDVAEKT
jgi:peptide deformylase